MSLEIEIKEIQYFKKVSLNAKKEVRKKLQDLKGRILAGESTGDNLKDFVIVIHDSINKKKEKPYRQLEKMLKGKEGEQILVVKEEIKTKYPRNDIFDVDYMNVNATLQLGVLTSGLEFILKNPEDVSFLCDYDISKKPRLIIPSKSYVSKEPDSEEWELAKGPIQIDYLKFMNFCPNGEKTEPELKIQAYDQITNITHRLLIKIGIENISNYFISKRTFFKDDKSSYVEALDLLKIGNQAPENFRTAYNEEIREEKKGIIKKLTTQESDEKMIKSLLERAVELGMSSEKSIIQGEIPGKSFNIQEYIVIMCNQYEIPYSNSN